MTQPIAAPTPIPGEGDLIQRLPGARWAVVPIEGATAVYWDFTPGAVVPRHNHYHAQFLIVLEGYIDMLFDDKTVRVHAGEVLSIPPYVFHGVTVNAPVRCVDMFIPKRDEYEEEYAAARRT